MFWISVYGIILFVGYSIPENTVDKITKLKFFPSFISDPLLHIITFGLFAILLWGMFFKERAKRFPYIKLAIYSLGFGVIIEIYQLLLPYRGFEFIDFVWDVIGLSVAVWIIFLFNLFKKKRMRSKNNN